MSGPKRILCLSETDNTIGPMFAAMLRKLFEEAPEFQVQVTSAGFGPKGIPIEPKALRALGTVDLADTNYTSRNITDCNDFPYDVVFCLDQGSLTGFGQHEGLSNDMRSCTTISNPTGKDQAAYNLCVRQISRSIRQIAKQLTPREADAA